MASVATSTTVASVAKQPKMYTEYKFTIQGPRNMPLALLEPSKWPECSFLVYQKEVWNTKIGRAEFFVGYMELSTPLDESSIMKWPGFYQKSVCLDGKCGRQADAIRWSVKPDVYDGTLFSEDFRIQGPWWYGFRRMNGNRYDQEIYRVQETHRKLALKPKVEEQVPKAVPLEEDKDYVLTESSSDEGEEKVTTTHKRLRRPAAYLEKYASRVDKVLEDPEMTTYRKRRILKYVHDKTY